MYSFNIVKKMQINRGSWKFISFLFAVLTLLVIFAITRLDFTTVLRGRAQVSSQATSKPINVLEIRYFPIEQAAQEAKVNALMSQLPTLITNASKYKGYSNPTATPFSNVIVKRTITRNGSSPYFTGPNKAPYHSMDAILTRGGENLCDYIVNNNIDQVWTWFDVRNPQVDNGGYNSEFTIVPSKFIAPLYYPASHCAGRRTFIFYGLDQNRTVGEALHTFSHGIEGFIPILQTGTLFWNGFVGANGPVELTTNCGSVHFPPNGLPGSNGLGYDYENTTYVSTKCENWKPDGTGTATTINCTRWGCTQEGYISWWLQNVPNQGNTLTYMGYPVHNWWDFISDTDAALVSAATNLHYVPDEYSDFGKPSYFDTLLQPGIGQYASPLFWSHAITKTGGAIVVTASYRNISQIDTDEISLVAWGTSTLTRAAKKRTGDFTSEIWYLLNPSVLTQNIRLVYGGNLGDILVESTTINGIDTTTLPTTFTNGGTTGNPSIATPTTSNDIVYGVATTYTGGNRLLRTGKTIGLWERLSANVISKGGATSGGTSASLTWTAAVNWPWSVAAIAFKQSQMVDLKINSSDTSLTVAQNTPLTITWLSSGSSSCTASGLWSGTKAPTGSEVVNSVSGGTYTLTCGTVSDSVPVLIQPAAVTADLKINGSDGPVTVFVESMTALPVLTWNINGTVSTPGCSLISTERVNGFNGFANVSGSTTLHNLGVGTYTYSIACGTNKDSVTLILSHSPATILKANFSDTSIAIYPNTSALLSWNSYGASSCTASGSWSGIKATAGELLVGPLTATSTFNLACGTTSDTAQVTLLPSLATNQLDLRVNGSNGPIGIIYPEKAVLNWSYTGTGSCVASGVSNWVGAKPTKGTEVLEPIPGTYTLTCGTLSDSVQTTYAVPGSGSGTAVDNCTNTYSIQVVK